MDEKPIFKDGVLSVLDQQDKDLLTAIAIGAIGAAIHYLNPLIERNHRIRLMVLALRILSSVFFSYLLYAVLDSYAVSPRMIIVSCGIMALLGGDASVKLLEKIFKWRLGIADENIFYPRFRGLDGRASSKVILRVDCDGIILAASDNAHTLFGMRVEWLVGQNHELLIPTDFRSIHRAAFTARADDPECKTVPYGRAVEVLSATTIDPIPCRLDLAEERGPDGRKEFVATFTRSLGIKQSE